MLYLVGMVTTSFLGGLGTDYLDGGSGNDFLAPGMGLATQQVDGGSGSDTISFFDWTMGVHIYLDENRAWANAYFDGSQVEFTSIENAEGSAFNDELRGNAGANVLRGFCRE